MNSTCHRQAAVGYSLSKGYRRLKSAIRSLNVPWRLIVM